MSGLKFVYALVLIQGTLLRRTFCQCNRTKLVIQPGNGGIESPNYPDELGKAANCAWEFPSKEKEHILVLTVVRLRLYFVVNGNKKCSGSTVLKMNEDTVDCKKYVDPPRTAPYCNSYYSSDKCNTMQLDCVVNKQTSFPVQVTYASDGGIVQGNNGPVIGFKIKYKYIECPPETTTTMSTPALTTTESLYTTEEQITSTSTMTTATISSTSAEQTTTAIEFISTRSNSDKSTKLSTVEVTETAEESETAQSSGSVAMKKEQNVIIIAASIGGGLLLILTIAMLVVYSHKRNRNLLVSEDREITKSTEVDQLQGANSETVDIADYATIADVEHFKESTNQAKSRKSAKNIIPTNHETELNIYSTVIYEATRESGVSANPLYSIANENQSKMKIQSDSAANSVNQSNLATSYSKAIGHLQHQSEDSSRKKMIQDAPCESIETDNPLYSAANGHSRNQSKDSSRIKMIHDAPCENEEMNNPLYSTEDSSRKKMIPDAPCESEETDNPLYSTANGHSCNQSEDSSRTKMIPDAPCESEVSDNPLYSTANGHSSRNQSDNSSRIRMIQDAPCRGKEMNYPSFSTVNEQLQDQPENSYAVKTLSNPTTKTISQPNSYTRLNENNGDQSDALYSEIHNDSMTVENTLYVPVEQKETNTIEESVYDEREN